ncbi:23S rRNA (uracil(1939)-C(5))-methyltransferase RlmD [Pseudoramibacter sp.]|jgi:23S rRNA (uracil-5-)-methyltransferase RumA|uniref:23S rRNA (uracil(1939)-C(5))-methyltransferase RlmD n=1 Tax=Pseudoramibacter sp. TaxID=2034862 RepID=UPI0025E08AC0|nr:23S rRNA (uracil(1939)-C(5))-methyltransferase RlmD [Pseudoramibacter sp.]MCH4071864.1 23S rRNA (uracil(1939)-C(5))-methyltransferase RlmD [Pseudoramibacter sp.]MCH4105632.1 23S rRNA (uracil(1939)-C(5))-methyltransferase RlmD [Pseudoramibacter sp.]
MKKGDCVDLKIEKMVYPGKGVGWIPNGDGQIPCSVKGAVTGQTLRVRIKKKRRGKAEGQCLEVLSEAPDARTPVCPVFGRCGGCTYQNLAPETLLEVKDRWVMDLLKDAGITDFTHLPALESPQTLHYRNKMEFSFGDAELGGPLTLGFHEKGHFYNILNADACALAHPDFGKIVSGTRRFFEGVPYYHKRSHEGILRYLVVRRGDATGEILVNLITSTQGDIDEAGYLHMLQSLDLEGQLTTVIHSLDDSVADVAKAESMKILFGDGVIHDRILDVDFEITPFSFLQTNTRGAEVLYTAVRDAVRQGTAGMAKKPVLFDLYCGVGTIGQILSPLAKKVVGIEMIPEAVEAAKTNAAANGLTNCWFIAGDVKTEAEKLTETPDVIVLDPPRDGVSPKALHDVVAMAPKVFVYVSCKARSLARDLPYFVRAGYTVETVQCVDMFPQTPHVETVVLLSKVNTYKE